MGHKELTQRILAAEARVDSSKMRNGRLTEQDWSKIGKAIGRLEAPLYIDDNPNVTVMEIRAKARRLKARAGRLGLVVVDYLQLMSGRAGAENRQVEVSEISRGLKILARELEVPIMALSQLSRNLEARADKRPMLSDLRESGCLTADMLIWRADTGVRVRIEELAASGERDILVWTVDDEMKLVPSIMTSAFSSGVKPVYEVRLASGRRVRASATIRSCASTDRHTLMSLLRVTALQWHQYLRERAAPTTWVTTSSSSSPMSLATAAPSVVSRSTTRARISRVSTRWRRRRCISGCGDVALHRVAGGISTSLLRNLWAVAAATRSPRGSTGSACSTSGRGKSSCRTRCSRWTTDRSACFFVTFGRPMETSAARRRALGRPSTTARAAGLWPTMCRHCSVASTS